MQIGLNEMEKLIQADRKAYKIKLYVLLLIAIVVILFSLCLKTIENGVFPLGQMFSSYKTWIHLNLAKWLDWPCYLYRREVIAAIPCYYDVIARLKITALTFGCGVLLSMSGSLFQSVFRNPIAAPTMLGVNTGVQMGILVLVLQYGGMAQNMPFQKYVYCYIGAAAMLALIIVTGKISSGKNKFSVFDLLITGAILSQVVSAVRTYYTFSMENDQVLLLKEISNAISVNIDPISFIFLGAVLLICLVPIWLIRFSFNAVCFDNDEARSFGVNTMGIKMIALLLGTFMVTAAMVHCGSVGMVSLIAPIISRAVFGADFRKVFWGNLLVGGTILVVCRDIASMIPFTTEGLPVGTVVDFVAVPIFVVVIIMQRRVWE